MGPPRGQGWQRGRAGRAKLYENASSAQWAAAMLLDPGLDTGQAKRVVVAAEGGPGRWEKRVEADGAVHGCDKFTMLKPQLVTTKRVRLDVNAADRPPMQPRVVNQVLTSTVNTTLNLQQLVTDLKFEYNPQRFAAATAHFSVPHITWSVA